VARSEALCFGVTRGEIDGRFDVNFWRLTPLFHERFRRPVYAAVPLGSVVSLVQYGCSSLASELPIGVPMLRMNNLQDDGWDLRDLKYIELGPEEIERFRVAPGDLLFNRTNSKELVGKCEVFSEPGDWVFASYLIRLRLRSESVLPQFASDFLNTRSGRLQIDRLSRQIIGMTNINAEELKEILIPVPALLKQREFVTIMDAARAARSADLAKADDLLAGLDGFLLEALGLTPPQVKNTNVYATRTDSLDKRIDAYSNQSRFRVLFSVLRQSGYPIMTFGEIANRIFSGTTPLSKGEAYATPPGGVRFIRSGEITRDGEVTPTSEVHIRGEIHNGVMKRSRLERGDLLIAIVGATIGAAGVFDRPEAANINQAIAAVRLKDAPVLPEFACLYLRSSFGQALLDYFKRPVARANINLGEIAEIPLAIPPREMQTSIIEEAHRRRAEARRSRAEAESQWSAAKLWFEEQLLGSAPKL
jgi:restriction endonuclease S subunit